MSKHRRSQHELEDDDDDEEGSFHSADEGDGQEESDSSPLMVVQNDAQKSPSKSPERDEEQPSGLEKQQDQGQPSGLKKQNQGSMGSKKEVPSNAAGQDQRSSTSEIDGQQSAIPEPRQKREKPPSKAQNQRSTTKAQSSRPSALGVAVQSQMPPSNAESVQQLPSNPVADVEESKATSIKPEFDSRKEKSTVGDSRKKPADDESPKSDPIKPVVKHSSAKPSEISAAKKPESIADSPQIESPPGADGWDLDDWDAAADDEGGKDGDDSDSEIMATPSGERMPSFPQQQQWTPQKEMGRVEGLPPPPVSSSDQPQKPSSLWGGWGHQLLSMATDSINTLTNTVGESFTSVLETVETSLGAPTPEDLAKMSSQERDDLRKKADQVKEPAPVGEKDDCDSASEDVSSEGGSDTVIQSDKEEVLSSGYQSDEARGQQHQRDQHGFTSLFSGVSHLFENTGRTLVTGSLDVLETLGRKTFETVTVAEPSGENQRRRLKIPIPSAGDRSEKPNLSQVLRELKEKAELDAKQKQQEQEAKRCNYAALFEDAQGLVHLEALELLSSTCCQQTQGLMDLLTPDQADEINASMEHLKSLFEEAAEKNAIDEDPTEQDLASSLKRDLKFTSFTPSRMLALDEESRSWIKQTICKQENGDRIDAQVIHENCMTTLAKFTAAGVEMFHKIGQMLLIPNALSSFSSNGGEMVAVKSLISIDRTLSEELSHLSARYTAALNTASDDSEDPDAVNRMLTNVFYESSNSVGYVQEAFKLMFPIVQLASVRERLR